MRHRKAGRSLRRTSEQRLALLRNLATSLLEQGAIETTEAKAKELRPFVEKLITTRKDYQKTLEQLHAHYMQAGDFERARWAKDELIANWRKNIHLGLDLSGGTQLEMEVQLQDSFKAFADTTIDRLKDDEEADDDQRSAHQ